MTEKKPCNVRIDRSVSDALDRVCADHGYTKGRVVQKAIEAWLIDHDDDHGRVGL